MANYVGVTETPSDRGICTARAEFNFNYPNRRDFGMAYHVFRNEFHGAYANYGQSQYNNIPVFEECIVCFESYDMNDNIADLCDICNTHLCLSCIEKHIITKIKDNNVMIRCPCEENAKIIDKYHIKDILSKVNYKLYEKVIKRSKNIINCPICMVEFYNEDHKRIYDCDNCSAHICLRCEENHDEDEKCKMIDLGVNSDPCPNCGIHIIKDQGCDHMTCTNCRYEYSYSTGEAWHRRSYNTYNGELRRDTPPTINNEVAMYAYVDYPGERIDTTPRISNEVTTRQLSRVKKNLLSKRIVFNSRNTITRDRILIKENFNIVSNDLVYYNRIINFNTPKFKDLRFNNLSLTSNMFAVISKKIYFKKVSDASIKDYENVLENSINNID